ncbi:hypothetical protein D3C76_271950 [compost metagenome]
MAGQCVVRRSGGRGARGLADADGDGLTVRQAYHDWRARHWRADSCGVDDVTAFSGSGGRGQFHRGGVDGIGNAGDCRRGAWHEVFEVATGGGADRCLDGAGVFIDVVSRCRNSHGAGGFAGLDSDHGAVRQGHGHRRTCGVGQRGGVNNRTALSHRAGRTERQVGGVDGIRDGGRYRGLVGHQILVVAAGHVGDRVGQWCVASQCVVWRGSGRGASGLADADGNGLTVGQRYNHRRTGHRSTDGRGVDDVAAFRRCAGSCQFHSGGVDGIGNASDGRCCARHQVFEAATSGVADRRLYGAGIFVDVVSRSWNGHGAGGFAGVDGDHGAVRQRHGHWRTSRVGQRCGVNNRTAFSDRIGSAERQVGGVDSVGHRSADRRLIRHEVFVVTAADVGDRVG